jgi:hypothetical protein
MDSFTIPFCVLIHYLIFEHCVPFSCFSHGFFLTKTVSLCAPLLFSILTVTGRCIPSLTKNPLVGEIPLPIEGIVDGTRHLAQLLNTGTVKRKIFLKAFSILLFLSLCVCSDSMPFVSLRLLIQSRIPYSAHSLCFPSFFHFSSQFFRQFQSYSETWWIIFISQIVTMAISLFWIFLMRFAAFFMVCSSIVACLALQGFGNFAFLSCLTTVPY